MKEKMNVSKRRKYDAAFKEQVLKMVEAGRPVAEVSQALGIGENLIYQWRTRYRPKAVITGGGQSSDLNAADFLAAQKRIEQLEAERDILKKALAIFSRQT